MIRVRSPPAGSEDHITNHIFRVVAYIIRKGPIEGPAMKVPFIGPFLDSMDPRFDGYHAKWSSGPLSCVSIFHK